MGTGIADLVRIAGQFLLDHGFALGPPLVPVLDISLVDSAKTVEVLVEPLLPLLVGRIHAGVQVPRRVGAIALPKLILGDVVANPPPAQPVFLPYSSAKIGLRIAPLAIRWP